MKIYIPVLFLTLGYHPVSGTCTNHINMEFCPEHALAMLEAWGKKDPRGFHYVDTMPASELVKFEARKSEKGIEITWETSSETQLDYFDLHRSIDGKTYESIYQVKAAGGTGKISTYRYLDDKVYEIAKDATRVSYQLYQVGLNTEEENIGGTTLLLMNDPLAQNSPQVTPKSPNVAAMQRFGNYPVNYYSGQAKIEIPIYDIELGGQTIPVKLLYNHSGNKVVDNASWVGLGWRLSCEYSITREVRQLKDEDNNGLLGDNLPPDYSQTCVNAVTKPVLTNLTENAIDGERDLFSYYSPFRSNSFVLTPSGVLFQEAEKSKLAFQTTSSDIGSFTLTDEQGNVLQYQDKESSTIETINGVSSWHVTSIQTPVPNQKAVFTYVDNGTHSFNNGRYDWETYNYLLVGNPDVPTGLANSAYNLHHDAQITSRLLNEIYFPNGKITFVTGGNREDGFGKRLDIIEVRTYNFTTTSYDLIKQYKLWHSYKMRSGSSEKMMFLDSVQLLTNGEVRLGSYTMTYNSTALPDRQSTAVDFWGYFNNQTNNTNLIPQVIVPLPAFPGQNPPDTYTVGGAINRNANETAMQAWILTQLTYPTGGSTVFTYEAHKYKTPDEIIHTVGGLRIKKMVSQDGKGKTTTKRLNYGVEEDGTGSFRDLSVKTVTAEQKIKNPPTSQSYHERTYSSDLAAGLIPQENQIVTYGQVTEYEDNAVGTFGKTVYLFKDDAFDTYTFNNATGRQYISSLAWKRGQLLSKTIYGQNGDKKQEENYSYSTLGASSPNTGYIVGRHQLTLAANPNPDGNGCYQDDDVYEQQVYQMTSGTLKMNTSSSITYNDESPSQTVTGTTSYLYNTNFHVREERFTNSDGSQRATIYRYCTDISGVTSNATGQAQAIYRLQQNNQLTKPIEILKLYKASGGSDRVLTGTLSLDRTFPFSDGRTYVLPDQSDLLEIDPDGTEVAYQGFGVLSVVSNTIQKDSRYVPQLIFDTYDIYGNVTKYHRPAGPPTGLEYDTDPVNGVYHSVVTKETTNKGASPGLEYATTFTIEKPLLGVKQISAPNGLNTSFEYDAFGRFLRSKDHDSKILVEHAYQFAPGNFIKKYLPRIALSSVSGQNYTNVETITGYYDGLGRPLQTVHESGGPDGSTSIVEGAMEYDHYDRIAKSYRTYSQTSSSAYELPGSVYGDSRPFGEVSEYDLSPLHRPKKSFGPGEIWKENNKFAENKYLVAAAGEVRRYPLVFTSDGGVGTPTTYGANSLLKMIKITEQGNETRSYHDNQGRLLQVSEQVNGTSYRSHYHIYDIYDRKRYVLQPVYFDQTVNEFDETDLVFTQYIFGYRYDARGRLIRSHVPGAGWTEVVYDRLDRPVLTRTSQQVSDGKWSYLKYDPLGRVIESGVLTSSISRAILQNSFNQIAQAYETWNTTDYTSVSFPAGLTLEKRIQNIYDTYPTIVTNAAFDATHTYHPRYTNSGLEARGLLTISLTWDSRPPARRYHQVFYYDNKNRLIQTIEGHHLGGDNLADKPIKTSFQYNFPGDQTARKTNYKFGSLADVNHTETFMFDHKGRPVSYSAGTAAGTPVVGLVCASTYDETGRLKVKKFLPNGQFNTPGGPIDFIVRPPLPSQNITEDKARQAIILEPDTDIQVSPSPLKTYSAEIDPNATGITQITDLQSMDYRYNIRDWLTGINSHSVGQPTPNALERDLFSLSLEYETAGYYDGNIGKQSWSVVTNPATNEMKTRSYTYTYDASSRLNQAIYTGEITENYDEKDIVYDNNGNITALKRYGEKNGTLNQLIDQLTYTYSGNRLTRVEDAVGGGTAVDFVNRTAAANEYGYFADGSLKVDGNEDIQNIIYDSYLKKPVEVQMTGGRWIRYTYNGFGALLRRELSTGEVWDYAGNMVLKNNQYYQIQMPEGRVVYESNAWHQEYEYRDHAGNLRVVFREQNDNLVLLQASDYSPFGVQFNRQQYGVVKQNYEYQGHETQPDHGLRRIMMGARCLNPTTGRMDGVDNYASAAPQWSSYRFAFNNPVMYTDPDGNLERTIYNSSTDEDPPTFNNGFREVSFRAAAYSVGFIDLSGSDSGEEGEYRLRAGSNVVKQIFNYKGDPLNTLSYYDDYLEWVPQEGSSIGPDLTRIKSIMFEAVTSTPNENIRPPALNASMIATSLDYYNIKNAFYAKLAYDTYDIGKVSPAVGNAGKVIGRLSMTLNAYDYYRYVRAGGNIVSSRSTLLLGDVTASVVGLKSAAGFAFTVGWEVGKALGNYKNRIEKKWEPGGLDGLISSPE